jgi:hypothetical protein
MKSHSSMDYLKILIIITVKFLFIATFFKLIIYFKKSKFENVLQNYILMKTYDKGMKIDVPCCKHSTLLRNMSVSL